jgi:hypothetical protein
VVVIGRHDDQRVAALGRLQRDVNGIGELDGLAERTVGVSRVMGVIDAPALDHQKEAPGVPPQNRDRDRGHLRERRLPRAVLEAIGLVAHVGRIEQTEQVVDRFGSRVLQLSAVPDVGRIRPTRDPLRREVASIEAPPSAFRKLGVRQISRPEVLATPTQHDLDSVAEGELDELPCDVREARGPRRGRELVVALPSPVGGVGVEGAGRGVGDGRRRDQAGGETAILRSFDDRS